MAKSGWFSFFLLLLAPAVSAFGRVPHESLQIERGNLYIRDNNYEEAEDAYQQALKANPADPKANLGLGVVYFFSCRPGLAIIHLELALKGDPTLDNAQWLISLAHRELHQYPEALIAFQKYKAMVKDAHDRAKADEWIAGLPEEMRKPAFDERACKES